MQFTLDLPLTRIKKISHFPPAANGGREAGDPLPARRTGAGGP